MEEFHRERQRLLAYIIERQEIIMAAQDDINAAVTALNELVAHIQANPPVDTTALNAAVAAAVAIVNPPAAAPTA